METTATQTLTAPLRSAVCKSFAIQRSSRPLILYRIHRFCVHYTKQFNASNFNTSPVF